MKITLDHNCIIHLSNLTDVGKSIQAIVSDTENICFVVNIGASEMREKGVFPDRYDKFEELLIISGIDHLPRLDPMGIYDVTFWDRCLWADEEMSRLADAIEDALFPEAMKIDITTAGIASPDGRKWLNRLCDVYTMWCHIRNANEVFLTSDSNFSKKTKLPKLLTLGAGRICRPEEL